MAAIDAYWRAANYLTVGQIYLAANPLLREPLRAEHVKARLLGPWGTSSGLSLVYAHLNRLIREQELDLLYFTGPGHAGPAMLANGYLEETCSEADPEVSDDARGMLQLFRRFSTPAGEPSHVDPTTPGSIDERGELGFVLARAFGAVCDHPALIAVAVVDGEAETAPLAGVWQGIQPLDPVRDGAVLPILHLDGYKLAAPTVFGRETEATLRHQLEAHGYRVRFVTGHEAMSVHHAMAAALELSIDDIREIQATAHQHGRGDLPRWPLIVLRTPEGWTGPRTVDNVKVSGMACTDQVPLAHAREDPTELAGLERWLRSYRPDELFDAGGRLARELRALAPRRALRLGASR